ncbi:Hypothetical protein FKW44_017885, partial [Caligus rogercresseyi]
MILVGDLNITRNPERDASGYKGSNNKANAKNIETIMVQRNLVDLGLKSDGTLPLMTFHRKTKANKTIFSRLDYVLSSYGLSNLLKEFKTLPCYISDHHPIFLTFFQPTVPYKSFWKL